MSSTQFNISDAVQRSVERGMQRGMEKAANILVNDVTHKLAEEFGFNVDDAIEMLGAMTMSPKKRKAKVSEKKTIEPKVLILPWCGEIRDQCCQAIKSCSKLYVQCDNAKPEDGDYCKRCQTQTDKNGGTTPYGVIQDRLNTDYKDKKGEKPINYGNYMQWNDITRDDAEAEATKRGWTIPEDQFIVVVKKKGRKPKSKKDNVEASDTDDEKDHFAKAAKTAAAEDVSSGDESSDDDEPIGSVVLKKRNSESNDDDKVAKRMCVEEDSDSELEEDSMSDSDQEGGKSVEPFDYEGKDYTIDNDGTVYDGKTHKRYGQYDKKSGVLTPL